MKPGLPFHLCLILLFAIGTCGCMSSSPQSSPAGTAVTASPVPGVAGSTATGIPVGRGQFVFNDSLGNADRPITVYTYRPASWTQSGPILIVMPGAGRTGESPRDTWIPYTDGTPALFSFPNSRSSTIPGTCGTRWGTPTATRTGSPGQTGRLRPSSTFSIMSAPGPGPPGSPIFLTGTAPAASLLHRLATFLPNARYSRAVAANAGVYVMPDYSIPYPFGLKDSPLPQSEARDSVFPETHYHVGRQRYQPQRYQPCQFPSRRGRGQHPVCPGTGLLCTCTGTGSCTRRPAQLGVPCRPGHRAR